ncbi:unnamed protein product, partial [Soboliphyme baturini]|uniref:CSD domain-containing protein n=1 Tax=Soboliphyme baturini TaxID=241478 RepID=A0A183J4N4_9BILA
MADLRNDGQLPSVPEGVMLSSQSNPGVEATIPPDTQRRSTTVLPHSPFITRRERRDSLNERAAKGPVHYGVVKYFCREQGHGYITSYETGEDVFVHISEYVSLLPTVEFKQ